MQIPKPFCKILTGDAYDLLDTLELESIDCVWASPNPPMMFEGPNVLVGAEENIYDYVEHLQAIFRKCHSVLKNTGSLWIRIGDYHNQRGFLNCVPARLQLQLVEVGVDKAGRGWYPMGDICWQRDDEDYPEVPGQEYKPPTDRFLRDWEHMLWFVKDPTKYFFNPFKPPISGVWHHAYNYTDNPSHIPHEIVAIPLMTTCPSGGTVLDPFHGRGNTAIVALKYGLNYIGIELLPSRVKESIEKIKQFDAEIITTTA